MEQKQADDAGPKQTTVAQWVFRILKMQLNYLWTPTHSKLVISTQFVLWCTDPWTSSTFVLWSQTMTLLYSPAEWCCNVGCVTYFVSEDGLRCKYFSYVTKSEVKANG
jgi:hypothetical protein